MTTLAWRGGVLAADSMSNFGSVSSPEQDQKVFRVKSGICAFSGSASEAMPLVDWLKKVAHPHPDRSDRPTMADGSLVVHVTSEHVTIYEGKGYYPLGKCEFMAWGSGAAAALGAMHMGATAARAVKVARKVDIYTGGRITTLSLLPHVLEDGERA